MFEKFNQQISYCTFCPKLCRFSCPVTIAEARETVTPTNKMNLMHLLRGDALPFSEETAEIFYHCAGCLSCRAFCKHRIDVPEVIEEARRLSVDRGVEPKPLQRYMQIFEENSNPYGERLREKFDALGLSSRVGKKADTVFFIGCTTMFHFPEVALSTTRLLEAAGIDFAVHGGDVLCCGTPPLLSGARSDFISVARENAKALKPYKRIISGCPSCLATMKFKYEKLGVEIKADFIHTTQLFAGLVREGKIRIGDASPERVMYHDPCHLGKFFGIFDEPRYLLSQLFRKENIQEFSWNRDKNACCGGGGLLPITIPGVSREITSRRLDEYREAASDMLITACPTCERTFHRADQNMKVRNLIQILAEHTKPQ